MFHKYIIATFAASMVVTIAEAIYKIDAAAYEVLLLLPAAALGVTVAYRATVSNNDK